MLCSSSSVALQVSGQLPSPWGDGTAFSQLETLDLQQNYLTGQLPVEWGENNAWSALKELRLASNNLTSTIPDCWVETEVSRHFSACLLQEAL